MSKYQLSKGAVLKLLRDHDASIRTQRRIAAEEVTQAIDLYQAGLSLKAVGDKLGFNDGTIMHALERAGIERRDHAGRKSGK